MQYSIPLPANFGAERIRARVSERRALFDDHPGLIHKSFIYSERDHLYAPFYVWQGMEPARAFLLDDLFKGVIDTFSRHRVRSWIVLSMAYGNRDARPEFACREVDVISPEEGLQPFLATERALQAEAVSNPMCYMHLTALDADRWEVMRYSLWKNASHAEKSATDCHQMYDVLHVSEPVI